jgi:hypothetical protein
MRRIVIVKRYPSSFQPQVHCQIFFQINVYVGLCPFILAPTHVVDIPFFDRLPPCFCGHSPILDETQCFFKVSDDFVQLFDERTCRRVV